MHLVDCELKGMKNSADVSKDHEHAGVSGTKCE